MEGEGGVVEGDGLPFCLICCQEVVGESIQFSSVYLLFCRMKVNIDVECWYIYCIVVATLINLYAATFVSKKVNKTTTRQCITTIDQGSVTSSLALLKYIGFCIQRYIQTQ